MDKQTLIEELERLRNHVDPEEAHILVLVGKLLLDYINDEEVSEAFDNIRKWYV